MGIIVAQQFAASERTTAQQIPLDLLSAVNGLESLLAQRPQSSAPLSNRSPSTAAILKDIFEVAQQVVLSSLGSPRSKGAKEAAEKAKTWGMVGAVVAVVVAVVVVIIASFGVSPGSPIVVILISAGDSICNFMCIAKRRGHPLAGEFGDAVSQIRQAVQDLTNAKRNDTLALDVALKRILRSVRTIEVLVRASGQMTGPCTGDTNAVYRCGQQIGPLLGRLAKILRSSRLLPSEQTKVAIHTLQAAKAVLTTPPLAKL